MICTAVHSSLEHFCICSSICIYSNVSINGVNAYCRSRGEVDWNTSVVSGLPHPLCCHNGSQFLELQVKHAKSHHQSQFLKSQLLPVYFCFFNKQKHGANTSHMLAKKKSSSPLQFFSAGDHLINKNNPTEKGKRKSVCQVCDVTFKVLLIGNIFPYN